MARKGNKQNVDTDAAPHKTEEEVFAEMAPDIVELYNAHQVAQKAATKANAEYRAALKKFKSAGGNTDALTESLKLKKLDPQEIDRRFRSLNLYLRLLGVPVGTTLGQMPNGESIATELERAAGIPTNHTDKNGELFQEGRPQTLEAEIRAAKTQGFNDGIEGRAKNHNYADGSPQHLAYDASWLEGQARLAEGAGKKAA